MKVIIDRFEEYVAIVELENKNMIDMPRELIPEGAKEGDIIEILIDKEETSLRKGKIDKLMNDLWE